MKPGSSIVIRKISFLLCAGLFLVLSPSRSFAEGADGAFKLDGRIGLNALQGVVEDHLAGVLNSLRALAATQDVKSADWERVKGPLGQLSGDLPSDAAMWFARPDGSYFTVAAGPTGETLKDRDYFPALMTEKDVNGSLVISKSTGERSVIVATPVVKDGQVVGALGATISVEKLAKLVNDKLRLPKDVIFYALDASGRTALHKDATLMFQFPSDLGDESLKSAVGKMLAAPEGTDSYSFRGVRRTVIFERSQAPDWVFVLGIKSAE
jgi:methyl-accepting chemotaxis protein